MPPVSVRIGSSFVDYPVLFRDLRQAGNPVHDIRPVRGLPGSRYNRMNRKSLRHTPSWGLKVGDRIIYPALRETPPFPSSNIASSGCLSVQARSASTMKEMHR